MNINKLVTGIIAYSCIISALYAKEPTKVTIGVEVKQVTINNNEKVESSDDILCINTELFSSRDSLLRIKLQQLDQENPESITYSGEHICVSKAMSADVDVEEIIELIKQEQEEFKEIAQNNIEEDPARSTKTFQEELAKEIPNNLALRNFGRVSAISVSMLAVWWMVPAEKSGWEADWGKRVKLVGSSYKRGFTHLPVWDDEAMWWVNWVAHPYCGSQTYLMQRNYGKSVWNSFLFSTGMSFAWEYLFEASVEHPSATDLVLTSSLGSILGEGIFQATRALKKGGFTKSEKVIVTIINPSYALFHGLR